MEDKSLFKKLHMMQQQQQLCDLRIISSEGTTHFAHAAIIVASCPNLRPLLTSTPGEHILELDVPDYNIDGLLEYAYTGATVSFYYNKLSMFMRNKTAALHIKRFKDSKIRCKEIRQTLYDFSVEGMYCDTLVTNQYNETCLAHSYIIATQMQNTWTEKTNGLCTIQLPQQSPITQTVQSWYNPFFCDICCSCFPDFCSARKHTCLSDGDTPFCCKWCGELFSILRNSEILTVVVDKFDNIEAVKYPELQTKATMLSEGKDGESPNLAHEKNYVVNCSNAQRNFNKLYTLPKRVNLSKLNDVSRCTHCGIYCKNLSSHELQCASKNDLTSSRVQDPQRKSNMHHVKTKQSQTQREFKDVETHNQHPLEYSTVSINTTIPREMVELEQRRMKMLPSLYRQNDVAQSQKDPSGKNPNIKHLTETDTNDVTTTSDQITEQDAPLFMHGHDYAKPMLETTTPSSDAISSIETPSYKCDLCNTVCSSRSTLNAHIENHARIYCDKKSEPKSGKKRSNEKTGKGSSLRCPFCAKIFSYKHQLSYHVKLHKRSVHNLCKFCKSKFTTTWELINHRSSCKNIKSQTLPSETEYGHVITDISVEVDDKCPKIKKSKEGMSSVFCDKCGQIFRSEIEGMKHVTSEYCGNMYKFIVDNPSKFCFNYECWHCLKTSTSRAGIEKHIKMLHTRSGDLPSICFCGKAFNTIGLLLDHKLQCIKTFDTVSCDICNISYLMSTLLVVHKKEHYLPEDLSTVGSTGRKSVKDKSHKNTKKRKHDLHEETEESPLIIDVTTFSRLKKVKGGLQSKQNKMSSSSSEHNVLSTANDNAVRKQESVRITAAKKKLVECKTCNKRLQNKKAARRHYRLCHFTCVCKLCNETFMSVIALKQHKIKMHAHGETITESITENHFPYIEDANGDDKHGSLRADKRHMSPITTQTKVSDNQHDIGIQRDAPTIISCAVCKETFPTNEHLLQHVYTHLKCSCCKQLFDSVDSLFIHKEQCKITHAKPHLKIDKRGRSVSTSCTDSDATASCSTVNKSLHHKVDDIFCVDCGMVLIDMNKRDLEKSSKLCVNVAKHLVKTDKKYQCTVCRSLFVCDGDILEHLNIHDPENGIGLLCFCGRGFIKSYDFVEHKQFCVYEYHHISCKICKMTFLNNSFLNVHGLCHMNERNPASHSSKSVIPILAKMGEGFVHSESSKDQFCDAKSDVHALNKQNELCDVELNGNDTTDQNVTANVTKRDELTPRISIWDIPFSSERPHMNDVSKLSSKKQEHELGSLIIDIIMGKHCKKCNVKFVTTEDARLHANEHCNKGPFVLLKRSASFNQTLSFVDNISQDSRMVKCKWCPRYIFRENVRYHEKNHFRILPFQCFCGRDYSQLASFQRHKEMAHNDFSLATAKGSPIETNKNDISFIEVKDSTEEMHRNAAPKATNNIISKQGNDYYLSHCLTNDSEQKQNACDTSLKIHNAEVIEEIKRNDTLKINLIDISCADTHHQRKPSPPADSSKNHKKSSSSFYTCDCGKHFQYPSQYIRHTDLEHERCKKCDKLFVAKELRFHKCQESFSSEHGIGVNSNSQTQNFTTRNKSNDTCHTTMAGTEDKGKIFSCYCGKIFKDKARCTRHQNLNHYTCKTCSRLFLRYDLTHHVCQRDQLKGGKERNLKTDRGKSIGPTKKHSHNNRTVTKITKESNKDVSESHKHSKIVKCKWCPRYIYSQGLASHEKSHLRLKRCHCGKEYKGSASLKRHQRLHNCLDSSDTIHDSKPTSHDKLSIGNKATSAKVPEKAQLKLKRCHCGKKYVSSASLKRHQRLHNCLDTGDTIHDSEPTNREKLSNGNKATSEKVPQAHMHSKIVKCKWCPRYVYSKGLVSHEKAHLKLKRCHCGKEYKNSASLKHHQRIHHDDHIDLVDHDDAIIHSQPTSHENIKKSSKNLLIHICDCGKVFKNRSHLQRHEETRHEKCKKCGNVYQHFRASQHVCGKRKKLKNTSSEKPQVKKREIKVTDKALGTSKSKNKQVNNSKKSQLSRSSCFCGEFFSTKTNCERHKKLPHYTCKRCFKQFLSYKLKHHICEQSKNVDKRSKFLSSNKKGLRTIRLSTDRNKESGEYLINKGPQQMLEQRERIVKCRWCPRHCYQKDLANHEKIHWIGQSHRCHCGKEYSGEMSLRRHQRNHHQKDRIPEIKAARHTNNSKKPKEVLLYRCKCGKGFDYQSKLKRHEESRHEVCKECGKLYHCRDVKDHVCQKLLVETATQQKSESNSPHHIADNWEDQETLRNTKNENNKTSCDEAVIPVVEPSSDMCGISDADILDPEYLTSSDGGGEHSEYKDISSDDISSKVDKVRLKDCEHVKNPSKDQEDKYENGDVDHDYSPSKHKGCEHKHGLPGSECSGNARFYDYDCERCDKRSNDEICELEDKTSNRNEGGEHEDLTSNGKNGEHQKLIFKGEHNDETSINDEKCHTKTSSPKGGVTEDITSDDDTEESQNRTSNNKTGENDNIVCNGKEINLNHGKAKESCEHETKDKTFRSKGCEYQDIKSDGERGKDVRMKCKFEIDERIEETSNDENGEGKALIGEHEKLRSYSENNNETRGDAFTDQTFMDKSSEHREKTNNQGAEHDNIAFNGDCGVHVVNSNSEFNDEIYEQVDKTSIDKCNKVDDGISNFECVEREKVGCHGEHHYRTSNDESEHKDMTSNDKDDNHDIVVANGECGEHNRNNEPKIDVANDEGGKPNIKISDAGILLHPK